MNQANGKDKQIKIAFDYFSKENFLHWMKFAVALNPMFSVPFNIISIIEIFEKIKSVSKLMKNKNGKLCSKKIFFMRMILLFVIYGCTMITTNIAEIFDLVGSIFGPFLGFVFPVREYLILRFIFLIDIIKRLVDISRSMLEGFIACFVLLEYFLEL